MPLPSFGVPLSINDIHIEVGGTTGTTASLNDADIRGLIGKTSGAQNAISEYYGASATPEIRFEATGGNGGDANFSGGVGGKTIYTVEASSGTQFDVYVGDRANDASNANVGAGGGAGTVIRSSGTYLVIVGGGGGAGYFGGAGGNGGGGSGYTRGVTGAPAYSNGGGDGAGSFGTGTGGDESANGVRYVGFDGAAWNGTTLFGNGGAGGAFGGATVSNRGVNGGGFSNGGNGGDGSTSSDSGGGGGGGGYGGGAGGAILTTNGTGAGGGGGAGLSISTGLPAGITYVSASGSAGGNTVSGGQAEVKVYVNNVLTNTYSQGTSNTFTVP